MVLRSASRAVLISLAIATCAAASRSANAAPAATAARAPAPIHDYALAPYTQKGYPDTFKKWGAKGVAKIEKLRKAAADRAALSTECDAVDVVELSDQRSSPPSNIVIWVDCTNTHRFYFTEAELKAASRPTVSEAAKGKRLTSDQAKATCVAAIKSGKKYSSTLDIAGNVAAPRFVEVNGRWVVELSAPASEKARAAPAWARCIIVPDQPLAVDYADY